jgi:hypothetical protein
MRGSFNGGRSPKGGAASQMKKLELQKGGKLPLTSAEKYQQMMRGKVEEARAKSMGKSKGAFGLPGAKSSGKSMSPRAEAALKMMAEAKAAKENKKIAKMVAIVPKNYGGLGRLDSKGRIFDNGGNIVMKISRNGKIATSSGWNIGKYKPKNMSVDNMIMDALKKHSP